MDDLEARLAALPEAPGCYIFLDAAGKEIYVGKAKSLRRRVRSYFQERGGKSARMLRLLQEIAELRVVVTGSEVEALLLENQLIKDLQPRFNAKLKDDRGYPLLAISRDPFPRVLVTRDPGLAADYYGPFMSAAHLRRAYHFLNRVFLFRTCALTIDPVDPRRRWARPCLNFHIRRCSAPCTTRIDAAAYARDIDALRVFLSGRGRGAVVAEMEERMRRASADLRYEDAARLRDQLQAIGQLRNRGRLRDWSDPAAPVIDGEESLRRLQKALGLEAPPRVIEGFDVAHLAGVDVVAALVQFVSGVPNRDAYRRYKIRGDGRGERNDDCAAMAEAVERYARRARDEGRSPADLVLIDGGLPQVRAAAQALNQAGWHPAALVGLAKQDETLVFADGRQTQLSRRHPGLRLLMYVRDEAHRFSRRYHHLLQAKRLRQGRGTKA